MIDAKIEGIDQDHYWRIWQKGYNQGHSDGHAQGEGVGWQKGWRVLKERIVRALTP